VQDYRKLKVWERTRALTATVYRVTRGFPKDELYGMTNQMRRASVSIGANIAEGCGRDGSRELARSLCIASGSASELDCLILLARDLKFLKRVEYEALAEDLGKTRRMLNALARKVKRSANETNNQQPTTNNYRDNDKEDYPWRRNCGSD